jgi:hypothetical protein
MNPVRSFAFAGLAGLLVGCSTHPLPEDVTRTTTYDIVEKIRCEAKRAVVDHARGVKNAAIAYEFTFEITETNNASGDISANYPFLNGGSFSFTANAGSNRTRDANRNFKIVDSFDNLRKASCDPETAQTNLIYPIAGEIGMYEVVATFVKLLKVETLNTGDVFSFADTLHFTTTLSGGVQPHLTLSPVVGSLRVVAANADLNAGRTDVHSVVIALSAGPQTATAVALRSPTGGGTLNAIRSFGIVGSSNSNLSTTLVQSGANVQQKALYELDRQRNLALQARSQNLLVGP